MPWDQGAEGTWREEAPVEVALVARARARARARVRVGARLGLG